jgi:hypothetical protein
MIYTGFNEMEVNKIKAILDPLGVKYEVSVNKASVNDNNEDMKDNVRHYRPVSRDHSFLQIIIEEDFWPRVSEAERLALFDLRIYPDEVPEGLFDEPAPKKEKPIPLKTSKDKILNVVYTGLVILVLFLIVRRQFS